MSLSPKQAAFVREYLIDLNATQAAIRAGYSPKTANEQGSRLLTNVSVADAIAAAQGKAQERADVTVDRIVAELAKIAFSDPRDLFDADGRLKPLSELTDNAAASLAGIDVVQAGGEDLPLEIRKIKRWDKTKAIELLGRYLGMFKDKVEVSGASELADAIEAARRRAK